MCYFLEGFSVLAGLIFFSRILGSSPGLTCAVGRDEMTEVPLRFRGSLGVWESSPYSCHS